MARLISAEAKEDLKRMDLLYTPYTQNSGSQQGKGKNTANPRNGGTIIMPNPAYWPKGLLVSYKKQFPLYPYLQWLKTLEE